jgi:hypothetical protein
MTAELDSAVTPRRIDPTELTLREMSELSQLLGAPLSDVLQGVRQSEGIAATAWLLIRREDPTFTYEQALDLRPMRDIEIVNDTADPKASAAGNGAAPPTPLESGD